MILQVGAAPAVARIVLLFTHKPLPQFLAFYACLFLCVTVDTLRHRRVNVALAACAERKAPRSIAFGCSPDM